MNIILEAIQVEPSEVVKMTNLTNIKVYAVYADIHAAKDEHLEGYVICSDSTLVMSQIHLDRRHAEGTLLDVRLPILTSVSTAALYVGEATLEESTKLVYDDMLELFEIFGHEYLQRFNTKHNKGGRIWYLQPPTTV